MTIPKHPLHAQFDEILAEIFEVKDNWYFSKINFVFIFFIANFLRYFFIDFKDQGQICNLLVMRIPKLTLIIEIDEELTEIFKVKGKAQFPKRRWKHESNFCCRKVKSPYCIYRLSNIDRERSLIRIYNTGFGVSQKKSSLGM